MNRIVFLLACVAFGCHGRRVQNSNDKPPSSNNKASAKSLLESETSAAFNPSSPGAFRSSSSHQTSVDRRDRLGRGIPVMRAMAQAEDFDEDEVLDLDFSDELGLEEDSQKEMVDEFDDELDVDEVSQKRMVDEFGDELDGEGVSQKEMADEFDVEEDEEKGGKKEKPYHSTVISIMHKLKALSGLKPSGRSQKIDEVKLQRIVRSRGGINNRTLYNLLNKMRDEGDWELSIALLQSVELNVKLKGKIDDANNPGRHQLVKTAALRPSAAMPEMKEGFDPTAGIGEWDQEGEWNEEFEDTIESSKHEDEMEGEDEDEIEGEDELMELEDDDEDFMDEVELEDDEDELEEKDEPSAVPTEKKVQTVGKHGQVVDFTNPTTAGHYNLVISTCAAAGRWQEALILLERMKAKGFERTIRTYNCVLNALEKAGRTKLHLKILEKMFVEEPDLEPSANTLATAIQSCISAREPQRAMYFVFLAFDYDGIELTRNYFVKAFLACKLTGMWPRALTLLERLDDNGFNASVAILNSIMQSFAKAGEPYAAEKFARAEYSRRGIKPDIITYNTLVSAWAKAQPSPEITKIREVMSEMETHAKNGRPWLSPDTNTYNNLIYAYSRAGQTKEALTVLLEEMDNHKIPADKVTYTSAAAACNETGHWQDAVRVVRMAERHGIDIDHLAYSKVIDACGRAGQWAQACSTLDTIGKRGLRYNPRIVNLALSACYAANAKDAAERGIASLHNVIDGHARSVHSDQRPGSTKGLNSPPLDAETVYLGRQLMLVSGAKQAEVLDFVQKLEDATVQVKRPRFQPIQVQKARGVPGKFIPRRFRSEDAYENAHGRVITPKKQRFEGANPASKTLYIIGLPSPCADDTLYKLFQDLGHQVSHVKVFGDVSGKGNSAASVELASAAQAQDAINELNGQSPASLPDCTLTVTFSTSERKRGSSPYRNRRDQFREIQQARASAWA
mmetsp:Transcript_86451/g.153094  ORF Transcript_86451/g.153094 Transcript_86451/m.153094 type:complete len:962 (+) Transcript_86451:53-2938(+)